MHKLILYLALFFTPLAFGQFLNCDSSWTLPMAPPVELSAGFGDLRPNHFHMGIDIRTGGRENLPIYAIQDGYISRLKVSAVGYGWVCTWRIQMATHLFTRTAINMRLLFKIFT
jgi:murein DD-endopeptidase MepM/ murein hydrolase activator NlpD